jgi:hypothetical protein
MQEQEENIKKYISPNEAPESYQAAVNAFHNGMWYPWNYNEIVGYLNLYIMGTQFRADSWFITKKRINKGIIKKTFKYSGKEFEKYIPKEFSSREIFEFILKQINALNLKSYKRFHFDLRAFKVIGSFVNWTSLIDGLNSYKYPEFRKAYFEDSDGEKFSTD